jgi:hypothetical protein
VNCLHVGGLGSARKPEPNRAIPAYRLHFGTSSPRMAPMRGDWQRFRAIPPRFRRLQIRTSSRSATAFTASQASSCSNSSRSGPGICRRSC